MKIKHVLTTSLLFCASIITVANAQELSIERIMSAPSLTGTAPSQVKLSPNGERVTFIRAKATDNTRFDLWEYHIPSGQERILFDADDLHSVPETLSDEEKAKQSAFFQKIKRPIKPDVLVNESAQVDVRESQIKEAKLYEAYQRENIIEDHPTAIQAVRYHFHFLAQP